MKAEFVRLCFGDLTIEFGNDKKLCLFGVDENGKKVTFKIGDFDALKEIRDFLNYALSIGG